MKKYGKTGLAALALTALLGAGMALAQEPLRIGIMEPLTGADAYGGLAELEGVTLAWGLNNEVMGRQVLLHIADNLSTPEGAAAATNRLINEDKVSVLIGSFSSDLAIAGGEVAEAAGVPMICVSCSNPDFTDGKQYAFRAAFNDRLQADAAAYFAINAQMSKFGLLTDADNPYSADLSALFKANIERLGGSVVAEAAYSAGDADFSAQVSALMAAEPDLVFMPAYYEDGVAFLRAAEQAGAQFLIMGTDAMENPALLDLGNNVLKNFYHTSFPYDPSFPELNDEARRFTELWARHYPAKDANSNSAQAYSVYLLVLDAVKRAESSQPADIARALAETVAFPTSFGSLTFNQNHDPNLPVGMMHYRTGARVFEGAIEVIR